MSSDAKFYIVEAFLVGNVSGLLLSIVVAIIAFSMSMHKTKWQPRVGEKEVHDGEAKFEGA